MSSWTSWLTGKPDTKNKPREAIVGLRSQLIMLEKQEEHLNKKIEDETRKAKAAISTNKQAAQAALRRKKQYEGQLDRIYGTRMTLETQVNAIESANMNLETMQAMRKGAEALKSIHGSLNIDKVDATMDSIREQMDLTNEISDAISNPVGMGQDLDEDALKDELEALEQEELNERLVGADHVPLHTPTLAGPSRTPAEKIGAGAGSSQQRRVEEDDDEAELRALQAELAM
ncbi:ESCRT-III subunit protein snf7 [Tilletia horrida]|nr:ESCRT-III subunit protein snf7 [Tilletia horrida]KAK0569898.1 ESCRT-III subunit protein snf7 [Tilletia horrida]